MAWVTTPNFIVDDLILTAVEIVIKQATVIKSSV